MIRTVLVGVAVAGLAAAAWAGMRYAEGTPPSTLNPLMARDMPSVRAAELVYEGLITPPDAGEVKPLLAESWDVSPDGRTVTFRLKRGVRWHDGTPFTARDVVFTVEAGRDPANASPLRPQFAAFEAVEALDDATVRFRLARPSANPILLFDFRILPAHRFSGTALGGGGPDAVGTGPFRFAEWTAAGEIRFVANPEYHRPGQPGIQEVEAAPVPDDNIRNELLRYGAVDLVPTVRPRDIPVLEELSGIRLYPYSTLSYAFVGLNFRNPLLRDLRVRQAMVRGIDRQAMLKAHYGGRGVVISGPFPPASWAYNFDVKPWPHEPDMAAKLLEEAGVVDSDGDGVREKDGQPVRLRLVSLAADEAQKAVVLDLQQQFRRLGIAVEVKFLEPSAWRKAVFQDHAFDLVLAEWTFDHSVNVYSLFHSAEAGPGRNNLGAYANPEVDRLLEQSRRAPNSEALRAVYGELHRVLHDDLPYLFLWSLNRYAAVSTRIEGVRIHPFYFFSYAGGWKER
ncbi:ABC transporter substrate-binding protein [Deferrisoma palaeochoriense]